MEKFFCDKPRVVAHHVELGDFGQRRRVLAPQVRGQVVEAAAGGGHWAAAVRPGREWSNISMVKTLLSAKDAKDAKKTQKAGLPIFFASLRVLRG